MFEIQNLPIIIPIIIISLGLHEAMHAFAAHSLGDSTAKDLGRLSLNPLKHIDIFTTILLPVMLIVLGLPPILAAKPVPFNPARVKWDEFGAAIIGAAGPLTNLALACLGALILRLMDFSLNLPSDFYGLTERILFAFVVINLSYFVFNMLPIPPLDGSRVLYAFAPEWLQKVMYQIESMGIFFVLMLLFILLPFITPMLDFLINSLGNLLIT